MLAAIDIGNSAVKVGLFENSALISKFSVPTKRDLSPDDMANLLDSPLAGNVGSAIICSVVPELDETIGNYLAARDLPSYFVRPTDDLGLRIAFPVDSFGADRLVNSVAAAQKYGVPCIVVSLGTATTIDVVNSKREYLGGLIAAGMTVIAQALALAASKLPEIELKRSEYVIAQTTETAIRSGIVNGQIAMVEGLLERAVAELGEKPTVVATGGFTEMIASEIELINVVDVDLTLEGLRLAAGRLGFTPEYGSQPA